MGDFGERVYKPFYQDNEKIMRVIGLTGDIGSGKSFAAAIFKALGARIVDADKIAHDALIKGSGVYRKIVASFGKSILDAKGAIDRRSLAAIVFNDKRSLARLNSIVHPEVIREIKKRIRAAGRSEILVIDAPLICEANLTGMMDALVVVKAPKPLEIERSAKKLKISKGDVMKRMACQMPLVLKVAKADYCINNGGTKRETEKQVREIWQDIKKRG